VAPARPHSSDGRRYIHNAEAFQAGKDPARREAEVEAAVLAELIRGGPLAPAQIAERTGLDIGEVAAALQRLRREGLVDTAEKDGGVLYLWTGRR
jgi:DNA-binding transcriptional ArsR family regulator